MHETCSIFPVIIIYYAVPDISVVNDIKLLGRNGCLIQLEALIISNFLAFYGVLTSDSFWLTIPQVVIMHIVSPYCLTFRSISKHCLWHL